MGWFRKLFKGDEKHPTAVEPVEPTVAPPTPVPGDPYRGSAFVEGEPVDEVVVVGEPAPIYTYRGRVLALEPNRRGPLPLRSAVYTGSAGSDWVVRRVTFGEGGYRIDWEHRTRFPNAHDGYVARVGERIVFPRATGVIAFHLVTGRPCWELPHPAALQQQPKLDRDGNLVLAFTDQSWMVVAPRDGATLVEGIARSNRDLKVVLEDCRDLGRSEGDAKYANTSVTVTRQGLRVNGSPPPLDDDPIPPTPGEYPIDGEWEAKDWCALAGGKLAVDLVRSWGDQRWAAVGLLDRTSLEPLQLLELGKVTSSVRCYVVDDLLVLDTDVPEDPDDVVFVVDPTVERVVAMFRESRADAFQFDRDGARIWAAPL